MTSTSAWSEVIPSVEPLVYRVQAGANLGTSFAISVGGFADGAHHTMLVTAWHVVEDVVRSDEPLEFIHSGGTPLSTLTVGPVFVHPVGPPECDTALVMVRTREPLVDAKSLRPMPLETMLPRGADVGWLGFPALTAPELCFFRGVISGHRERPPIYLVDGIGISGVSGGPAFDARGMIVGLVSAYIPNQLHPGATLPGLLMITPLNLVRLWMQDMFQAKVITS